MVISSRSSGYQRGSAIATSCYSESAAEASGLKWNSEQFLIVSFSIYASNIWKATRACGPQKFNAGLWTGYQGKCVRSAVLRRRRHRSHT